MDFFFSLLLTLLATFGVSRLQVGDLGSLPLPPGDPALRANELLSDHFGGIETVTFLVESPRLFSSEVLKLIEDLTEDVKGLTGVREPQSVLSLFTVVEPRVTADSIAFKTLIRRIPTDPLELAALEIRVRSNEMAQRFLLSRDGRATLVVANLGDRAYPDPLIGDRKFQATHYREVQDLLSKYNTRGVAKVYATSPAMVMDYSQSQTKFEMVWITLLALALSTLLFYINSGTLIGTVIPLLIMGLSTLWTFGLIGWLGVPLSVVYIYVVTIIIAVGSSYPIHGMAHIQEQLNTGTASKRISITLAWFQYSKPLLTVALASVLSAISLLIFDIKDIRELGIFQALGVTFAFTLALFVLPILMFQFGKAGRKPRAGLARINFLGSVHRGIQKLLRLISWLPLQQPFLASALVLAVLGGSVYGAAKIIPNWVVEETIPRGSPPRQGYEKILENFGSVKTVVIVAENRDQSSFFSPKGIRELKLLEDEISHVPGVVLLPSWPSVFEDLRKTMLKDSKGLLPGQLTQEEIDQILFVVGHKRLQKMIDSRGERALLTVRITESEPVKTKAILASLRETLDQVSPGKLVTSMSGTPVIVESINGYVVRNKIESIILCLLIVFLLCSLINGSVKLGLVAMAPAALAGIITFALMGYFHIYLDIATSTITTIAIGVGVDFAMHFLIRFRADMDRELTGSSARMTEPLDRKIYQKVLAKTVQTYGEVIVFDALSNLVGLVAMTLSAFPPIYKSGDLLVFNQLLVIVTTFFLTPLLILIFRPSLHSMGHIRKRREL